MRQLFLTIALCLPLLLSAQDFRNVSWGYSQQDVITSEGYPPAIQNKDSLIYKAGDETLQGGLLYRFSEDQLVNAQYFFDITNLDEKEAFELFQTRVENIRKNYGPEFDAGMLWHKRPYLITNKAEELWHAVKNDQLQYFSEWYSERHMIFLSLAGGNGEAQLLLDFKPSIQKDTLNPEQSKG